ncbi:ABC transporter ATP-binding protein [Vallitalea okinawensis]|uniref:ABC transporter ATP-binding protein n=1 Tax=Vallitalea okinawensis TaxID=2078660 RepID=UPI000CFB3036|nr:ABC transporter ATP-binding protein [Vallitalea okinawensis]
MKEALRYLWSFVKHYKWQLLLALSLTVIVAVLTMINPYLIGVVIDHVIYDGHRDILPVIITVMIGVTLVVAVLRYVFLMNFESISQKVVFNIREDLYRKIQKLDFEFFNNNKTGDIMSRMTSDIEAIRHFVAWVVYQIFLNLLSFIFAIMMMMHVNFKITVIMLCLTPVIAFFAVKLSRSVRPTFIAIRNQFSKLNSVVQENISGNKVVKAFAKESYEIEKFERENRAFRDRNLESAAVWGKYVPILDSLAVMMTVVMLLAGGIMCINQQMSIGDLVIINGYLWAINGPLRMCGWLINDTQRFIASYHKLSNIIKTVPKIQNKQEESEKNLKGTVTFNHVSFKYDDDLILKDINFTAHVGQTVAILGPTGSGKSTLVNLICRFYDCDDGMVLIDGRNVRDINVKELRSNIAVAMQDIFLFSDTIEGNIAFGNPEASMKDVQWAAGLAGVEEFISKFPQRYDTIVGERGVGLSGGQKQRIALARALLRNPSILILDDTTSAVDMETEFKIYTNLREISKKKTTFIIAHRISSVKDADLILVMDRGKVVEKGTHKELIQNKGHYYHVFINQLGDFDHELVKEVG